MKTRLLDTSFDSAKENMSYDKQLLDQVILNKERIFRVYPWKNSGITYSYKQDLPEQLKVKDHSKRITGGGIVFHCPDDIVFSVTSTTEDPFFEKSLKSKLSQISQMIQVAFKKIEFELNTQTVSKNNNLDYCQSYHNPFELYYKTKKVVAFSLRKTRQALLFKELSISMPIKHGFQIYQKNMSRTIVWA